MQLKHENKIKIDFDNPVEAEFFLTRFSSAELQCGAIDKFFFLIAGKLLLQRIILLTALSLAPKLAL